MPRIYDSIAKSIVYLYPTLEVAENASNIGATAFFVGVPYEQQFDGVFRVHPYIGTNEHVSREVHALRLNLKDGKTSCIEISDNDWHFPHDGSDLALLIVGFDLSDVDLVVIPTNHFLTEEFIAEHDIGMGDEVFIVGRFKYHEGKKRVLPSARFGNIAQMPEEPIKFRRTKDYTFDEEAFLVEMRSIGGYSGSPTYVHIPVWTHRMTKDERPLSLEYHVMFMGVDVGHLPTYEPVKDGEGNKVNDWYVEGNSAMTGIIPAWKLRDFLDKNELKQKRKQTEDFMIAIRNMSTVQDNMAIQDDDQSSS